MRLKFLFFPIILIVSISIFVGFIWPVITELKMANQEKMEAQKSLDSVNEKKAAIDKVNGIIESDSEGEAVINGYLPNEKVEERILTSINFLATSSEVSLVDISLASKNDEETLKANEGSALSATAPIVQAGSGSAAATAPVASGMKYTEASISLSGDYEKIRLFLDQLQRVPILNSVKSLKIVEQETADEDAKNGAVEGVDAQPNETKKPENLLAEIVVDFGWMPTIIRIDNDKIATFENKFDSNTLDVIKEYTSKNTPLPETFGNKDGKRNPFLAN